MIAIKRIYEKPNKRDGMRILVDRLWPRGIRREDVKMELWLKEIAPSAELRKWFAHDPKKWSDFKKAYFAELKNNPASRELIEQAKRKTITLLYSASDDKHNHAAALKEYLEKKI